MEKKHRELHKLKEAIEHQVSRPFKALALTKVLAYIKGEEKPKRETLDKMALFVGFQDWESFKEAVHGDVGADANYDEAPGRRPKDCLTDGTGKDSKGQ